MTQKHGFTLSELLVVVAIIAVLVAVAIPVFTASKEKVEEAACLANRSGLQRQCIYAIMTEKLNGTQQEINELVGEIKTSWGTKLCPCEGDYIVKALPDGTVGVSCTVHGGDEMISVWKSGASYTVGEKISAGDYIFRCVQAVDNSTKDPSLKKDIRWEAVESLNGIPQPYYTVLRYAKGTKVTYCGYTYARTDYKPTSNPNPEKGKDSQYWTLII